MKLSHSIPFGAVLFLSITSTKLTGPPLLFWSLVCGFGLIAALWILPSGTDTDPIYPHDKP